MVVKAEAPVNGKVKKPKKLEYIGGSEEFGGEHNVKVAIQRAETFWATLDDEQVAAFKKLLKDMRDHVGWTKGGRVLLTGKAERG